MDTSMEETATWSSTLTWLTTRSATCSICGRWGHSYKAIHNHTPKLCMCHCTVWDYTTVSLEISGASCDTGRAGCLGFPGCELRSKVQRRARSSESNYGQGAKTLHGNVQRKTGYLWSKILLSTYPYFIWNIHTPLLVL